MQVLILEASEVSGDLFNKPGSLQVQKFLLVPDFAPRIWVTYRPVLASLVSGLVDDLCAGVYNSKDAPSILISLVDILTLAPHLDRFFPHLLDPFFV